jgi:predicted  nucleic acid-binding Zn-ribbon protein
MKFFEKLKDKAFTITLAVAAFVSFLLYFLRNSKSIEDLEEEKKKIEKENSKIENDIQFNSGKISSLNELKDNLKTDSEKEIEKHTNNSSKEDLDEFFDKRGF